MTVLIKQRKPDPETLERYAYIKENVEKVGVYRAVNGQYMIYIQFEDGRGCHYSADYFDFQIQ